MSDTSYQGIIGDDLVRAVADDLFTSIRILRHQLNGLERLIMIDLDQVLAEMQSQSSMLSELSGVVATLSQHVVEHSDGTVVAPVVQEKINKLMADTVANKTLLADTMKIAVAAVQAVEAIKTKAANLA